jgi:MFS transporter, FSR family, fosmidomycin resistance protein
VSQLATPCVDSSAASLEAAVPVRAVGVSLVALACGHLAVDCCSGIWPVYKTIAHLDLAITGAIATTASMVGNGLQIAFGLLADRGYAKMLLVGGALLAGCITLVPYTHSYALMLLLGLGTAVGSAAFHPTGTGSAAALSRERTGMLVALFLAGGYVGYSLSQVVFTATYRSMHGATAVLLLVPMAGAFALWRFVPAPVATPLPLAAWARSVRAAAGRLSVLFAIQVFATAINSSLVFLLPDLLHARGAPSLIVEGGGHFALVLGGCLALLPAGLAADRFGARHVLLATNLLAGIAFLLVLHLDYSPFVLLPLITLFGALNCANNVVVVAAGNRLLPGQNSGVSALLMGFPWCFSSFSSVISGILADPTRGGTATSALGWMAFCIPVTLSICLLLPRRQTSPASPSAAPC